MKQVIVLSVSNDGGDDGTYNGHVIGTYEGMFQVEELTIPWCERRALELSGCEGDECEDIELSVEHVADKSYAMYISVDQEQLFCFKIV